MSDKQPAKPTPIKANESYDCDVVIPFSIKKNGKTKWYCVGEMSGEARDVYLTELKSISATKTDAEGNVSIEMTSYTGMSTMMLKHCIYGYDKESASSTDLLIEEKIIATWPTSLLDSLVVTANNVNAMGENQTDIAKND